MKRLTKRFSNLSIGYKITLVTLIASMAALLAVAGGLYAFQQRQFRQTFGNELQTLARILAENCAVPLAFDDPKTAKESIAPLAVKPEIRNAAVLTIAGKRFAEFGDDDGGYPPPTQPAGIIDHGAIWTVCEPIMLDGKRVGTFFLDADFARPQNQLRKLYASVTGAVLAGSLVIVLLLTYPLQKFITRPIYTLAAASDTIAREHDYSVRVTKHGTDEIGLLTDAFNKMLGQIHGQDSALQKARDELRQQLESLKREVAERERAQAAQAQLTSIINGTPDFVGSWDTSGTVVYLNPAARAMLGIEKCADISTLKVATIYAEWAAKLISLEGMPTTMKEGMWAGETALAHRDGSEIHVSQVIIAHRDPSGEIESFSTVMRDITERKDAEEALRQSQRKLLETSRLAGMAEVATGVLHNVGNVLNSVNVSGNLITEKLRHSKSEKLSKVAALIEEQGENFSTFVGTDPRGKMLPILVMKIAAALRTEQEQLIAEVESITGHIGHIKQIVSMQQNFAKVGGLMEPLNIASVVEDALKISAVMIERHGITIERDFEKVPLVMADKHKVLQIFVNVLRNAKQAIEEMGSQEKRIVIRISKSAENKVQIGFKDNGRGIEPANLVRIFSHGFTTKKTGHGFGLHSGALAAKEMGGSLHVHSDGLGKGAEFTLTLPIRAVVAGSSR